MKICFAISSMHCGGAERVIATLSNGFVKLGHEVSIALISTTDTSSFYQLDNNVSVISVLNGGSQTKFFKRVKQIKATFKSINPDVVIAFLPHICVYCFYALKGTKIPLICSERNDPHQYNWKRRILLKHVFKKSDGCVFQTHDSRKFYSKVKESKSIIIPNPVFLLPSEEEIANAKKDNFFISVGRLEAQKNFPFLIKTFKKYYDVHDSSCKLRIYGDGSLRESLQALINSLSLEDSVILGESNPRWHYEAINSIGFISTSNFEGMPNCLEEALCLGTNCIATDCPVGGSRDLIEMLQRGTLIKMNSEEELLNAMIACKNNSDSIKVNYDVLKPENITKVWLDFILKTVNK